MSDSTVSENPAADVKNPLLNDRMYKILEYMARVVLPALATLYLALVSIWHFPYGAEVVGTLVAIDTFLGVFLGIAQKSYDSSGLGVNGTIDVTQNADGTKLFSLNLNGDPEMLQDQSKVVFKVNSETTAA